MINYEQNTPSIEGGAIEKNQLPHQNPELVSVFPSVTTATPSGTRPLADIYHGIKNGEWQHLVMPYQAMPEGSAEEIERKKAAKPTLPNFTIAGTFRARNGRALLMLSGHAVIDFDHVSDLDSLRGKLTVLPYVKAVFVSVGGKGIKAVIRTPDWIHDAESFKRFLTTAMPVIEIEAGHSVDPSGKDLSRACFVSYDPDILVKESATPFPLDLMEAEVGKPVCGGKQASQPPGGPNPDFLHYERVVAAVRFIATQGRPGHDLWIRIIAVVQKVMPKENALSFLKSVLPEETEGEYEAKLRSPLMYITPEIFLREAQTAGWTCPPLLGLSNRTKAYIAKTAYVKHCYAVPADHGYTLIKAVAMKRHLIEHGVPRADIERVLTHIEKTQTVDAEIDLFARPTGVLIENGHRILVSRETVFLPASPGFCDTAVMLLLEMLGEEQYAHFIGWLMHARVCFKKGSSAPGQALLLAGPVKSGKSLLIALCIECLGGRYASGFSYLTGRTDFNREIATSGLMVLDDELDAIDGHTRAKVTQRIKAHLFSRKMQLTSKFSDSISLTPIGRLIIALNDTTEAMQTVPKKAEDTADKIMVLRTRKVAGGLLDQLMGDGSDPDAALRVLRKELPAFLTLVETHKIPAELRDPRTGVKSYWNSELLDMMHSGDADAPIIELLERIRLGIRGRSSALEIMEYIRRHQEGPSAIVLGNMTTSDFGRALGRITKKRTDLIIKEGKPVNGSERWVFPPAPPSAD